jgi:hypothetical protein
MAKRKSTAAQATQKTTVRHIHFDFVELAPADLAEVVAKAERLLEALEGYEEGRAASVGARGLPLLWSKWLDLYGSAVPNAEYVLGKIGFVGGAPLPAKPNGTQVAPPVAVVTFNEWLRDMRSADPNGFDKKTGRFPPLPGWGARSENWAAAWRKDGRGSPDLSRPLEQLRWIVAELRKCLPAQVSEKENRQDRPARAKSPRARLRVKGNAVYLGGERVPLDLTEESRDAALCYLRHLLSAEGDWRSGSELNTMEEASPICKDHCGIRWDIIHKRLPECLRNLIETDRRKGRRLTPGALRR